MRKFKLSAEDKIKVSYNAAKARLGIVDIVDQINLESHIFLKHGEELKKQRRKRLVETILIWISVIFFLSSILSWLL